MHYLQQEPTQSKQPALSSFFSPVSIWAEIEFENNPNYGTFIIHKYQKVAS